MCLKLLMLGEITEIVNGSIRSVNSPERLSGAECQAQRKIPIGELRVGSMPDFSESYGREALAESLA